MDNTRECVVCGVPLPGAARADRLTCSPTCKKQRQRDRAAIFDGAPCRHVAFALRRSGLLVALNYFERERTQEARYRVGDALVNCSTVALAELLTSRAELVELLRDGLTTTTL